jgi:hypothetical protein
VRGGACARPTGGASGGAGRAAHMHAAALDGAQRAVSYAARAAMLLRCFFGRAGGRAESALFERRGEDERAVDADAQVEVRRVLLNGAIEGWTRERGQLLRRAAPRRAACSHNIRHTCQLAHGADPAHAARCVLCGVCCAVRCVLCCAVLCCAVHAVRCVLCGVCCAVCAVLCRAVLCRARCALCAVLCGWSRRAARCVCVRDGGRTVFIDLPPNE